MNKRDYSLIVCGVDKLRGQAQYDYFMDVFKRIREETTKQVREDMSTKHYAILKGLFQRIENLVYVDDETRVFGKETTFENDLKELKEEYMQGSNKFLKNKEDCGK